MIDFLPGCLEYGNEANIYYNGTPHGSRPPDEITQGEFGLQLVWDLEEIGALAPGESIAIEYDATAEYPGENTNLVFSSAHCAYDYSVVVSDQDTATVFVIPEEPPVEEVLYAYVHASYKCYYEGELCQGCNLIVDFWAEDLTGGERPVTNVILRLNGVDVFNSGPISTVYYENLAESPAWCGETIDIELVAMNLTGQTVTVTGFITLD